MMLKKLKKAIKAARAAEIEAKATAADAWKVYIDTDAAAAEAAEDARVAAGAEDARVAARARVCTILHKMIAKYQ